MADSTQLYTLINYNISCYVYPKLMKLCLICIDSSIIYLHVHFTRLVYFHLNESICHYFTKYLENMLELKKEPIPQWSEQHCPRSLLKCAFTQNFYTLSCSSLLGRQLQNRVSSTLLLNYNVGSSTVLFQGLRYSSQFKVFAVKT